MSEFDEMAMSWDDDPTRKKRAQVIVEFLQSKLDLTDFQSAFEYGSGTGLLSFAMQDQFESIDLMDASEEMTKVAELKINKAQSNHMRAHWGDLLSDATLTSTVDIIYTMLTLHHVKDTVALLRRFRDSLNPNGKLVIIDLEQEDGSFHDHRPFEGHNGFSKERLTNMLQASGFKLEDYDICFTISKMSIDQEEKHYPVFMAICGVSNE